MNIEELAKLYQSEMSHQIGSDITWEDLSVNTKDNLLVVAEKIRAAILEPLVGTPEAPLVSETIPDYHDEEINAIALMLQVLSRFDSMTSDRIFRYVRNRIDWSSAFNKSTEKQTPPELSLNLTSNR